LKIIFCAIASSVIIFSQHFTSSFYTDFLLPKHYKNKLKPPKYFNSKHQNNVQNLFISKIAQNKMFAKLNTKMAQIFSQFFLKINWWH